MPLNKSCSQKAFDANVSQLVDEGYEQDQALAIAFSTLKKACGVESDKRMTTKEIIAKGKGESVGGSFSPLVAELDDLVGKKMGE